MNQQSFHFSPIGVARTPYPQKFGIARQSGLVPAAQAVIVLNAQFNADTVRGLDEFDYVWVQFVFHQTLDEGFSGLVRPPRLGGKIKKGVFATRSPHRPNAMGLSLLKLERIEYGQNIKLYLSGADLLDGTPILDIKPYLPHIESKPDAKGGFTEEHREVLNVQWLPESQNKGLNQETVALIEQSLAQDPRPAHQHGKDKEFVMQVSAYDVRFMCIQQTVYIISVTSTTDK
ncbi:MAG: tRNA (N6-threonylcarbamoyladenosine(37)-N6)-methyltransferase TrmO [Neisseria sp.]|nr:tRNA (N6-threonylcarbamoyladenosine(37)-N6)-methyltransferase TrmO [Neisseria sp.]